MRRIKVALSNNPYDIIVGAGIIGSLGARLRRVHPGTDAFIITNSLIKNKHGKALAVSLARAGFRLKFKLVPDTERSKSLPMAEKLIAALAEYDVKKKPFVIAFGGGVVGDLSGFVASIYKRGINYVQVPTTFLAQVDSAIGGKTAVDLSLGKNLVGAFYQPRLVFSDIAFLKTLGPRQLRAGLAEVIKYAVIKDAKLFAYLEKNLDNIFALKDSALKYIVERSSRIKAGIVAADEKETKGIRMVLNFGHTLGHAIEAAGGYSAYNHGEGVALGMLFAADISRRMGFAKPAVTERIQALIKRCGLPTRIKNIPIASVVKAHYRDKKFIGRINRFVLITGIGSTKIVRGVPLETIKSALKAFSY